MPPVHRCCWLGGRKGIRPVKRLERWAAGVAICLEHSADLHTTQLMPLSLTVSCFSKIQIGFTFLVLGHLGSPAQRAVKWVCAYGSTMQHTVLQKNSICYTIGYYHAKLKLCM